MVEVDAARAADRFETVQLRAGDASIDDLLRESLSVPMVGRRLLVVRDLTMLDTDALSQVARAWAGAKQLVVIATGSTNESPNENLNKGLKGKQKHSPRMTEKELVEAAKTVLGREVKAVSVDGPGRTEQQRKLWVKNYVNRRASMEVHIPQEVLDFMMDHLGTDHSRLITAARGIADVARAEGEDFALDISLVEWFSGQGAASIEDLLEAFADLDRGRCKVAIQELRQQGASVTEAVSALGRDLRVTIGRTEAARKSKSVSRETIGAAYKPYKRAERLGPRLSLKELVAVYGDMTQGWVQSWADVASIVGDVCRRAGSTA